MAYELQLSSEELFVSVLKNALKVPGVKIEREKFLKNQFNKHYSSEVIELAIQQNPASAGIPTEVIDKIAKACIRNETRKVTSISAVAGIPGGLAAFGTVPADIAQYYGHVIRVLQKLVYLYGWNEIFDLDGEVDDETMNQLTLFIGVMFGVNTANAAIGQLAKSAAAQAQKDLVKKPLTKGTIYPIAKRVARLVGVKMTKDSFAKGVGKIIPLAGTVISGGLTYSSFLPMANRLKNHLRELPIADVEFYKSGAPKETVVVDFETIIDAEFEEIEDEDHDNKLG
ncbi:hypothetical protein [Planococcus lenghuensis]|uniref:EcsC family protein n=1 Tax=Planococcus lenghuensis TaxID=2213202 RepID=A0A1Q2KVN9_9BACL|nr:hypothetical protein [Planococcus lenghuensis]AQQ52261.1 hypothetical protein B0X71_03460 [Planococcus lenghuensis]